MERFIRGGAPTSWPECNIAIHIAKSTHFGENQFEKLIQPDTDS